MVREKAMGFTGTILMAMALLIALLMGFGCATLSLPKDATPAQRKSAACIDAQQAVEIARIGIALSTDKAERQYWQRYATGAEKAVAVACKEVQP